MVQDVEELKGARKRRLKDVRTCCSLLIVFVFPALSLLLPPCVSCGPQESRLRSPSGCLSSMVAGALVPSPDESQPALVSFGQWFYMVLPLE